MISAEIHMLKLIREGWLETLPEVYEKGWTGKKLSL